MTELGISAPQLAEALIRFDDDVDESRVRNWRRAQTLLPIHLAQPVAHVLGLEDELSDPAVLAKFGYDPMVMVRLLGLIPMSADDTALLAKSAHWQRGSDERMLIERLRTLERIELDLAYHEDLLAALDHHRAAQTVLQAVEESAKYAAAFWPVHAGPSVSPDHLLHVSDRVDLRRLDGEPATEASVWDDLGEALSRARALPSSAHPRWCAAEERSGPESRVSMWNLRRLDVPRRPRVPYPHPRLPALVFSATVSSTWVGNLASLVALVLGYGVTSTTDLGRGLAGDRNFKPNTLERCRVHNELLRNPGERRIWFHASKIHPDQPGTPWRPENGISHPELVHIRLRETDELLAATAEDRSHYPDFTPQLESEWKTSRDRAIDIRPHTNRVLVMDVGYVPWGSTEKWRQTFERVTEVLKFLEALGFEPWDGLERAQERWVEDDHNLTRPAFTWLRQAGSPLVFAPKNVVPNGSTYGRPSTERV